MEWGSPVLSQPAAATYNMITEHSYTDVREVMADLGITAHDTALRHLLTLYDWGLVDEGTLLQLHYLDQGAGTEGGEQGHLRLQVLQAWSCDLGYVDLMQRLGGLCEACIPVATLIKGWDTQAGG